MYRYLNVYKLKFNQLFKSISSLAQNVTFFLLYYDPGDLISNSLLGMVRDLSLPMLGFDNRLFDDCFKDILFCINLFF